MAVNGSGTFCSRCGTKMRASDKFCTRCGEVRGVQATERKPRKLRVTKPVLYLGGAIGIAIAVVALSLTFISINTKKSEEAQLDKFLALESTVKGVLPYYSPSSAADYTWQGDFYGVGCDDNHNYKDTTTRMDKAQVEISQLSTQVGNLNHYKHTGSMGDAVDTAAKSVSLLTTILDENRQLSKLAMDTSENVCFMPLGTDFSNSLERFREANATANPIEASMRTQASTNDQYLARIKGDK